LALRAGGESAGLPCRDVCTPRFGPPRPTQPPFGAAGLHKRTVSCRPRGGTQPDHRRLSWAGTTTVTEEKKERSTGAQRLRSMKLDFRHNKKSVGLVLLLLQGFPTALTGENAGGQARGLGSRRCLRAESSTFGGRMRGDGPCRGVPGKVANLRPSKFTQHVGDHWSRQKRVSDALFAASCQFPASAYTKKTAAHRLISNLQLSGTCSPRNLRYEKVLSFSGGYPNRKGNGHGDNSIWPLSAKQDYLLQARALDHAKTPLGWRTKGERGFSAYLPRVAVI